MRFKLARLGHDGRQCRQVLSESLASRGPVPDRPMEKGCGLTDAVEVSQSSAGLSREFTATCSLTVAWALYETRVLQPAARGHFGQGVAGVTPLGTYACRNVNHRTNGLRGEHATANAIDIAGFGLGGGRQVTVKSDWKGDSAQRSAFLRALMDEACDFFAVVLSPNYNQAHHDHFHFDMGPIGHADEGLLIHMTGAGLSIS